MKRCFSGLTLFIAIALPAAAQSVPELKRSMELSREGHWGEAAEIISSVLQDSTMHSIVRCEAFALGAFPFAQIGEMEKATALIHSFDAECAVVSQGWPRREINKMRTRLELGSDPQAVEPPPMRTGPPISAERDDWPEAEPATLGLDTLALAQHRRLCEQSATDACLVVYKGQIVQELYGPDYREPMYAMSSTKSVASLVAGLLIADGKLGLDDPVSDYIPEWKAGAEAEVTVRHLLTMTAGLDRRLDMEGPRRGLFLEEDKEAFVFSLPLDAEPGERWAYSNEGVFLLSPLMDRAAGEPFEEYARRGLFEPIGMHHTSFYGWPEGQARTHADLETTPRDLARIGQLMLQRGRWNGVQVVPEEWVDVSLAPTPRNPDYGLLWWLDVPGGFAARGYLDTNVYVLAEQNLVVVRMQSKPKWAPESYEPAALDLFHRFISE